MRRSMPGIGFVDGRQYSPGRRRRLYHLFLLPGNLPRKSHYLKIKNIPIPLYSIWDYDRCIACLDLVFCRLVHNLNGILDHLQIQHARDHFVNGLGIGFLVAHPKGSDKPDNYLLSLVEKPHFHLGKLLPQRRQPSPVGKDHPTPCFLSTSKTGFATPA